MAAMKRGYSIPNHLFGYKKAANSELAKHLEVLGFKREDTGIGSGGGQVVEQVIAYLTLKEFWLSLFTVFLVNRIENILSVIWNWHNKNRSGRSNLKPIVAIYIYPIPLLKKGYFISFDINKQYSKKEIKKKIRKASKQ